MTTYDYNTVEEAFTINDIAFINTNDKFDYNSFADGLAEWADEQGEEELFPKRLVKKLKTNSAAIWYCYGLFIAMNWEGTAHLGKERMAHSKKLWSFLALDTRVAEVARRAMADHYEEEYTTLLARSFKELLNDEVENEVYIEERDA